MVVCIVSDGRAKINARTLSVLAAMGVYQDGVAKNVVAGKPVTAHIYEYTTQSELLLFSPERLPDGLCCCRRGAKSSDGDGLAGGCDIN